MKPMLSATLDDLGSLRFPVLASPKIDGIRSLVMNGVLLSRKGKPLPNLHTQRTFGLERLNGLDGELIVGSEVGPKVFSRSQSGVMTKDGEPSVRFFLFDYFVDSAKPFNRRLSRTGIIAYDLQRMGLPVEFVEHRMVTTPEQLIELNRTWLEMGYEGTMTRDPQGFYKYGRSTAIEQGLMKWKTFQDAEAVIIGFEEQMKNTNDATRDLFGKLKRSSHKAGMVGKGTLGALIVRGLNGTFAGVEFNVSGFDAMDARIMWDGQKRLLGQTIKYKYFPQGSKDKPRHPIFLGLRRD